ncbi:tyrosine-type recombinase/integrase [Lentzea tibetensis]|uniref:Tyrosine-type recombinase/integrase n=1 Tax=Lentzea tibetensis TaxID=2591470 RepID=A0A563F245_9PSEU|nr:tyrosine-type recombinase/integrase [Lentzea tibetensis]
MLVGEWAAILIISAAYTGARWGELTGLQRTNIHLDDGFFVIDPDIGALHEVGGKLSLGPPKTAASARTVPLPPFLIDMWRYLLGLHNHPHIFVSAQHQLLRRSNFARRAMRPAADGNLHITTPLIRVRPVKPGLVFHGLRHSQNTWLIGDGIPEVARALRLGHKGLRQDPRGLRSRRARDRSQDPHVPPETLGRRTGRTVPERPRLHRREPPVRSGQLTTANLDSWSVDQTQRHGAQDACEEIVKQTGELSGEEFVRALAEFGC